MLECRAPAFSGLHLTPSLRLSFFHPPPVCRHPEKNAFEWTLNQHIPHHPDAIEVTQEVANLVVGAARRSAHAPASLAEEQALLIYNWAGGLEYSGRQRHSGEEVDFDQIYVFPDAEAFLRREAALAAARAGGEAAARPHWRSGGRKGGAAGVALRSDS